MTSQTSYYFMDKPGHTHKTFDCYRILNDGGHNKILDSIILNTNNR